MDRMSSQSRFVSTVILLGFVAGVSMLGQSASVNGAPPFEVEAWDSMWHPLHWHRSSRSWSRRQNCDPCYPMEGTTYWLRSPEQEKRVVMNLYNRYCVRCHGVDGRGVWDIPDVPDLSNAAWQASRTDDQLARLTLEGRGAVMPAFRGTFTLEESYAMARYLRSFVPGTEVSRPLLPPNPAPPAAPPAQSSTTTKGARAAAASSAKLDRTKPSETVAAPIQATALKVQARSASK